MSEPIQHRAWANSSLVAALAWIVLAILPVPGTTLLGLPFGFYAVFAGLVGLIERGRAGDRTGVRRAGWGAGLGCLGFIIAWALDLVVAGVIVAAAIAAIRAALGVHFR